MVVERSDFFILCSRWKSQLVWQEALDNRRNVEWVTFNSRELIILFEVVKLLEE